jgi:drug/metabolite transporter (DMT)-like permease
MDVRTLGLERSDGRNMLAVAGIVTLVVAVTAEGPVGARVVAGAIVGVVAALVFVASTVLINRYKPDHW